MLILVSRDKVLFREQVSGVGDQFKKEKENPLLTPESRPPTPDKWPLAPDP